MHPRVVRQIVFAADLLGICLAAVAAYLLRTGIAVTPANLELALHETLFLIAASGIAWTFISDRMRLDGYDGDYEISAVTSQLLIGLCCAVLLVTSAGFLLKDPMSRLLLAYFAVLFFLAAVAGRLVARILATAIAGAGKRRRVLILGKGRIAQELAARIRRHPELRWELAGFLFPSSEEPFDAAGLAGESSELHTLQIESLLGRERVDEVILASRHLEQTDILNFIAQCRNRRIRVSAVPHLYQLYVTRPELADLHGLPLLTFAERNATWLETVLKRAADVFLSLLFLLVAGPAWLFSAVLLRLRKGRALVTEARCGQDGKVFPMFRFNSDRRAPGASGAERLLQKLSFTEFPQLLNVLRGEMSLVGPRPESEQRVRRYSEWQRQRLRVKPGVTGLAQVHGLREDSSSEDKAYFDLQYIQSWSLLTDLSLILQTVSTIGARFLSRDPGDGEPAAVAKQPSQPVELAHADRS